MKPGFKNSISHRSRALTALQSHLLAEADRVRMRAADADVPIGAGSATACSGAGNGKE
jgi:hypothetical protein